jgi:hypothetical protein
MLSSDNYSGQTIGNYQILEKLGSGEFGSVYRAKNTVIAERIVAIKIINKKYASSPQQCTNFINEARVLGNLQHQYILPVLDVGERQGTPYIVIEFAPNGSLRNYMERFPKRQVPVDKALTFLLQVVVLVIAASAGFFLFMNSNQSAQRSANATATAQTITNNQATATVVQATRQATSPFPLFRSLAFYDLLVGSSNSHWESSSACDLRPSGYGVSIVQHGGFKSCKRSSPTFKDFAVMVTMSIQQGDCGGITFRDAGVSYYVVLICSAGTYNLGRVKNGSKQWKYDPMKEQPFISAIHQGSGQQNLVAVVFQGNAFSLYVNDLTRVTDVFTDSSTPLAQGSIGLVASDLKNPTMVMYTNAVAWT